MLKRLLSLTIALTFFAGTASAASYKIDPVHSQVHFTVPHLMMFKVRGEFTKFAGGVELDDDNRITAASAVIRAASIDTNEAKRDEHLRSADFFDSANFPELTFQSTRFEINGDKVTAIGKLTIRGTTRDVVLHGSSLGVATDPWGIVRAGFEATTTINRHDYGLSWNKTLDTGGVVVGDTIVIGLEIQAIKQ